MSRLRSVLFWLHLAAGLVAGTCIGIMCLTGAALAFEKDLVAWSERDARRVQPPAADAARLPLAELTQRVRERKPDARPTAIIVSRDPSDAVTFAFGRDGALYANPYTGEVRAPASTRVHDILHVLEDWHRVLAFGGERREVGKMINGAANVAFCLLALTGLYLWLPRSWSWRGVRAVAVVNFRLTGKARDFNWHNAVGLWAAPVLIVLTLTALPISYRWAGNLVYRLVGEEAPAPGPGAPAGPALEITRPAPDARPLAADDLLARARERFPAWETLTLRLASPARGNAAAPRSAGPAAPSATTIVVKEPGSWPRTATTTLTLDPFTGETLRTEAFGDLSTGRQIRGWMRFLHTGEALGRGGQLVAGLACLGGGILVYTGFALAWRRLVPRRPAAP